MTRLLLVAMLMIVLIATAVCIVSAGVGAADKVNVTFEDHFGGTIGAVAVSCNYAYIWQGQDFVVLDMSNPASPVELGDVLTECIVSGIELSGN